MKLHEWQEQQVSNRAKPKAKEKFEQKLALVLEEDRLNPEVVHAAATEASTEARSEVMADLNRAIPTASAR